MTCTNRDLKLFAVITWQALLTQASERLKHMMYSWLEAEGVETDNVERVKEVLINFCSPALIAHTREKEAEKLRQWTAAADRYEFAYGIQTVPGKGAQFKAQHPAPRPLQSPLPHHKKPQQPSTPSKKIKDDKTSATGKSKLNTRPPILHPQGEKTQ